MILKGDTGCMKVLWDFGEDWLVVASRRECCLG